MDIKIRPATSADVLDSGRIILKTYRRDLANRFKSVIIENRIFIKMEF